MDVSEFRTVMKPVIDAVAGRALDQGLADDLNRRFPPDSPEFRAIEGACHAAIEGACHAAIEAGWMCSQGAEGRRFGRVIEAESESANLSVDVVDLTDIVGPHHSHPTGEVCMTMPVTPGAKFDGHSAGWCVNPPGSAHHPTVTDGRALVLYLLPDGQIKFTK